MHSDAKAKAWIGLEDEDARDVLVYMRDRVTAELREAASFQHLGKDTAAARSVRTARAFTAAVAVLEDLFDHGALGGSDEDELC